MNNRRPSLITIQLYGKCLPKWHILYNSASMTHKNVVVCFVTCVWADASSVCLNLHEFFWQSIPLSYEHTKFHRHLNSVCGDICKIIQTFVIIPFQCIFTTHIIFIMSFGLCQRLTTINGIFIHQMPKAETSLKI